MTTPEGWTDRDEYAARAMVMLMAQHPEQSRGWVAEMAFKMADVMVAQRHKVSVLPPAPSAPFCQLPPEWDEDAVSHAQAG